MARYRLTPYHALRLAEERRLDLPRFLRGELHSVAEPVTLATSALTGEETPLLAGELELLRRLSIDEWRDAGALAVGEAELRALAERGLAVSDAEDDERLAELRRRDDALRAGPWNRWSALYHAARRGGDESSDLPIVDYAAIAARGAEGYEAFVARHGPPPPAFAEVEGSGPPVPLPGVEPRGGLFDALGSRRTRRAFATDREMTTADLATLLRTVFGPHGILEMTPQVTLLHRTSPSGGSLHPIEAYPLLLRVAGVVPGLYHYDGREHRLVPVAALDVAAGRELAVAIARGQGFVGEAHAVILLVARFRRNLWKYRASARTYSVVQMDAGHLGQTFYLTAAALGLAALFTAAIDEPRIERALGIEPFVAGPLALCACGPPASSGADLGLPFAPFAPRGES